MKKFEVLADSKINWYGRTLFRIKACMSFTTITGEEINEGDIGGWIEKEENLSHEEKAWISGDAEVWGNAKVWGNAGVSGDAEVWGNAKVSGDAEVWGNAKVWGNAGVWGNAKVWGNAEVSGDAEVWGNAKVSGDAEVFSTKHIFSVTPIGHYGNSLTVFRTKTLELKLSFKWSLYSLGTFRAEIENWDDNEREVAELVLDVAEKHIDLSIDKSTPIEFTHEFANGIGLTDTQYSNFIKRYTGCTLKVGE